jgi:hypothetical protein
MGTAAGASRPIGAMWRLCLANIAAGQKLLTLVSPIATLRAMRDVSRSCAAVQSASSTRGDLLLESLALRHQLSVLARSNRRFRPSDRLLWLLLRWWWPRWRKALVLVQPATVDRWHRAGLRRCWRGFSRRPGRPRIDSTCRDLIRRWPRRITSEALRGSMVSNESSESPSPNARSRDICRVVRRHGHRPGVRSSRTTSATWRSCHP